MAKRGQERPPKDRVRDILIDISSSTSIQNGGFVTNTLAAILGITIPEIILGNICRYCGPVLTRRANTYIRSQILTKIRKHPNINFSEDIYYRGALGIPKRFNKDNFKKLLYKALTVEVTACGYLSDSKIGRAARRTVGGVESLASYREENATSVKELKANLKSIVKKLYEETSFKVGGRKRTGKRNWLYEADTGKTKVDGFSVFPGPGEGLINGVQSYTSSNTGNTLSRYSRSGTHIMISGGDYNPNEWRPNPEETNVIENIFVRRLPGLIKSVQTTGLKACLNKIKSRLKKQAERQAKLRLSAVLGRQGGGSISVRKKDISSANTVISQDSEQINAIKAIESSDVSNLNIQASINQILGTKKFTKIQLDVFIERGKGLGLTVQQTLATIKEGLGI
jgi:hypothetical protein